MIDDDSIESDRGTQLVAEGTALAKIGEVLADRSPEEACRIMAIACIQLGDYSHAREFCRLAQHHRKDARRIAEARARAHATTEPP